MAQKFKIIFVAVHISEFAVAAPQLFDQQIIHILRHMDVLLQSIEDVFELSVRYVAVFQSLHHTLYKVVAEVSVIFVALLSSRPYIIMIMNS